MSKEPLPVLPSARLSLIPARADHDQWLMTAMAPEDTTNLQFFQDEVTLEREHAYLERMEKSVGDELFIILSKDGKTPLGTIGLHEIDEYHRTARFGILIFQQGQRGKGYGKEAIQALLRYAFMRRGLNKIYGKIVVTNAKNLGFYMKQGFIPEGRLREEYLLDGVYHDMIFISMLKSDWDRLQTYSSSEQMEATK